jgi:ABC-2 type transport system ATP-binding protein
MTDSSTEAMIEVSNLTKEYRTLKAVNNVSFQIRPGELFGFLGPNGAGKTTTMKMIAGLLKPTSGQIRVGGIDIEKDPVGVKRLIGYIPDRPFIYEKLTGREFLHFVAGLYDTPTEGLGDKIERLLHEFGLGRVVDELVENYSHGMKQRVTMASALIHKPRVIIVDEPMVGLDPKGSLLIRQTFRRLCEEEGVSIFLSTHTLSIAEEVCDRIGILYHGNLIALGTLEELQNRAAEGDASLEEIFLKLTEEAEEMDIAASPLFS